MSGFDDFVEGLDPPVFVVTAYDGTERSGCLVGFASQVSIDPPRFLVCLSVVNRTYRVAQGAEHLAVHVLDAPEGDLAGLFGGETGDEVDKFARCTWREGPGGVPLLNHASRRLVGRIIDRVPLGDHVGHVLEPVSVEAEPASPLRLEDVEGIDAGHPA